MCGFAGEFRFDAGRADRAMVQAMAAAVAHRGPDEQASALSADGRCAIGFRRLAVIDPQLSHQPMVSSDGQIVLAFNGEIYNFVQLRQELQAQGVAFATQGDTEVLLHLYRRDGVEMLSRLTGMFALAIYDARAKRVVLARDRLGEKPLWYAVLADRVVFASEAKALLVHPAIAQKVDSQSLIYYLSFGYVPAPRSIWQGVTKLPPAHYLIIGQRDAKPARYWQPAIIDLPAGRGDLVQVIRQQVSQAVSRRLTSDVPLGALLSGGADSAIIVALMAKAAGQVGGVQTFTSGFADAQFDERPAAARLAAFCGTRHTELLVTPLPAAAELDRVIGLYDEPFADSSAIATYLICQAARRHVTVALAGDGGDEVFGGYDRYRAIHLAATAGPAKFIAYRLAAMLVGPWTPHNERNRLRRFLRFADSLSQPPALQYFTYRMLFSPSDLQRLIEPSYLAEVDPEAPASWFCDLYEEPELDQELARAQHHDLMTYLGDDLLVKTDIASMASSLELRSPLLDEGLVNLGLSLPADCKVFAGRGKAILREAFADMVPPGHFDRPKRGFAVPLDQWLRGDLLETMRDTLFGGQLQSLGIFNTEALVGLVNDHLHRRGDHRHRIWALLVLTRWLTKARA